MPFWVRPSQIMQPQGPCFGLPFEAGLSPIEQTEQLKHAVRR
jgi:hypothetical protein